LASALSLGAASALAEPRGELARLSQLPEAELLVDVTLTGNDERAYFEITSDKTGASLLICGTPCQFRIWPGRYRLITNASRGYVGGTNQFVVEANSKVQVIEPNAYRPALGAIVGSVALLSAVIGGVLLATSPCGDDCSASTARQNRVGLALLGAGIVIAPAGWFVFAQNHNPELSVGPGESKRRE
jgi:hypothetical protein